ncbi:MAG: TerC family protein [Deltaproteobacteria bacterium]
MEPPGGCSFIVWVATLVLAIDNCLFIVLYTRNLLKFRELAVIIAILGAVACRGLTSFSLFQVSDDAPVKLIGGILLMIMVAWQVYSQSGEREKQAKTTFWSAVGPCIAIDLITSVDITIVLVGESASIEALVTGVLINIPILIIGSFIIEKVVSKWNWVLKLAPAVLFGTAVHMILSDSMIAFSYATIVAIAAGTILFICLLWNQLLEEINNCAALLAIAAGTISFLACLFWNKLLNKFNDIGDSIRNPETSKPETGKPEPILNPQQIYI